MTDPRIEGMVGPSKSRPGVGAVASSLARDFDFEGQWSNYFQKKEATRGVAVPLRLPSSTPEHETIVMVRRIHLKYLLNKGHVPDALSPIVEEFVAQLNLGDETAARSSVVDEFKEDPVTAYNKWLDVLDYVWITCVERPRFAKNGEHDPAALIFNVDDVDYLDKLFVYQFCQGVDQSVQDFLLEQAKTLGTMADEPGVPVSSEPVVRIERRGGRVVSVSNQPDDVEMGKLHPSPDRGDGGSPSTTEEQVQAADGDAPEVLGRANRKNAVRQSRAKPK